MSERNKSSQPQFTTVEALTAHLAAKPFGAEFIPSITNQYRRVKKLGAGISGTVFCVEPITPQAQACSPHHHQLAVKCISKKEILASEKSDRALKRLLLEVTVLRSLRHPNIVELVRVLQDDNFVYLLMERCAGVTLHSFVNDHLASDACVSLDIVQAVARQLLHALSFLHSNGVVHRDIKLENILYDADTKALKVIDFGLAKLLDKPRSYPGDFPVVAPASPKSKTPSDENSTSSPSSLEHAATPSPQKSPTAQKSPTTPMSPATGSLCYIAREYLEKWGAEEGYVARRGDVPKLDMFGVGVVLHALLYGSLPFANAGEMSPGSVLSQMLRKDLHLARFRRNHEPVPSRVRELLQALLSSEPSERPMAADVVHSVPEAFTPSPTKSRKRPDTCDM